MGTLAPQTFGVAYWLHLNASGAHIRPTAAGDAASGRAAFGHGLLGLTLFPLVLSALMCGLSGAYTAGATSVAAAFKAARKRWWPFLGLNVLLVLIFGVGLIALLSPLVVFSKPLIVAMHSTPPVESLMGILMFSVALVMLAVASAFMFNFAQFACATEGLNPWRALGISWVRLRYLPMHRVVMMLLTLTALIAFLVIVWLLAGIAVIHLHSKVLEVVYGALASISGTVFITAVMCVFYYDIRVRCEGLDLEAAARASQPAGAPG